VPSLPHRHWARRLTAGTPASKLYSPRESVPRRPHRLARLRPPVGALLGFSPSRALSTTVRSSVSRVDTRGGAKPRATCASRRPAIAVALPRPGLRRLSSRAQDPSIRRVYRTPRITVEQRPSSPSASRALPCASRQPRPAPCRALKDGASCPCPLSAAPRASLPFTSVSPREGHRTLDLEDAYVEPYTRPRPLRDRLAAEPLAELDLVPRRRVDPVVADFRQRRRLCDPPLREEQVGSGPPCRQVGRLSWDFVPRRIDSKVRATSSAGLFAFRIRPFRI